MDKQTIGSESSGTLVEGVMATIRQRIAARSLTPGARLPSIRAFAKTMQVSKSTVVEAYERLAAEGAIRSRPGSGSYAAGSLAPLSLAEIGPRLDRAVDPLWISRQSLEAGDDMLKPGCGWLPASAGWRRADSCTTCGRSRAIGSPWPILLLITAITASSKATSPARPGGRTPPR